MTPAEWSDALARAACAPKQRRDGATVATCPACSTVGALEVRKAAKGSTSLKCARKCPSTLIAAALGLDLNAHSSPDARPESRALEPDRATVVRVADVEREHVQWIWRGRLPLGKLAVLDGDPGLGKSTLTLGIAASVSRGWALPGGGDLEVPAGVVIVSLEDGIGDTIRPRLEAAGADLERVHCITGIGPELRTPVVPEDLGEIERVMLEVGARLLVIDPLMAVLSGEVNAHRDQDVRRALAPLAALAERTRATALVVRHLNKGQDSAAIYRGGGSIGIIGAARVGLLVAKHPDATADDDPRRVLATVKGNIARCPPALEWSLTPSDADPTVAIVAFGESSTLTADQLLARPTAGTDFDSEAVAWLRAELAEGGARAVGELKTAARAAGMSWDSLKRAKERAKVISKRIGYGRAGEWVWQLNEATESLSPAPFGEAANPPLVNREHSPNAPKGAKGAKGAGGLGRHPKGAAAPAADHPHGCLCTGDGCANPPKDLSAAVASGQGLAP